MKIEPAQTSQYHCPETETLCSKCESHCEAAEPVQPAGAQELRYTADRALAECPCCGSLDVGGVHDTVNCYGCGLTVTAPRPLQNAINKWNQRTNKATAPAGVQGERSVCSLPEGWRATNAGPCEYLTDEANKENRIYVERTLPPFEGKDRLRSWSGPDLYSALKKAHESLGISYSAPAVDVTQMVNRFLGWKLPLDFAPDCGISIDEQIAGQNGWPSGTNLFNAEQAKEMFEYVTQGKAAPAVAVNEKLAASLKKANDQAEHFEREWYLRGDEIEGLKASNEQMLETLKSWYQQEYGHGLGPTQNEIQAVIAKAEVAKKGGAA